MRPKAYSQIEALSSDIDNCLKMFYFVDSIRKWIKLFFSNRQAYILLRGELTKKILLEQGVPPLPTFLF